MIHCVLNMNQQGNCKRSDIVFGSIPVVPGRHDRMDPEISGQLQYYAQGHQVYTSISIVSLCNVDEGAQIPYQNRSLCLVASYKTPPEGSPWLHTSPVSSILWLRTSISLRVCPQRELTRVRSSFLILILVIEVQDLVCPVEELPLSVAQSHC